MSWVWTPVGALGLLSGAALGLLAVAVYSKSPRRLQPRALACLLALETVSVTAGVGLMYMTDDAGATLAWQAVATVALLARLPLYPLFLSTLRTPIVRPLALRGVRIVLVALAPFLPLIYFWQPEAFIVRVYPATFAPWDVEQGAAFRGLLVLDAAISIVGLVAALDSWRRAPPGSAERRRNGLYAVAFGIRDIGYGIPYLLGGLVFEPNGGAQFWFYIVAPGVTGILFAAALAYAILRAHLFDIDLRVKMTLRRGTLAGIFIAAFFVASELAQQVFQASVGPYVGIVAAGVLVFAFSPLQRLADRISDAALPRVREGTAYVEFRKLEVFKAAVEEFFADGRVSEKERRALDAVRGRLGITASDARAVESDVRALYQGRAAPASQK